MSASGQDVDAVRLDERDLVLVVVLVILVDGLFLLLGDVLVAVALQVQAEALERGVDRRRVLGCARALLVAEPVERTPDAQHGRQRSAGSARAERSDARPEVG